MRICFAVRALLECICLVALLACPPSAAAQSPPSFSRLGNEIAHDSRWFVDSIQLDIEDIATSPLYVAAPQSPLRSPRFYLSLTTAAAVWGGHLIRPGQNNPEAASDTWPTVHTM